MNIRKTPAAICVASLWVAASVIWGCAIQPGTVIAVSTPDGQSIDGSVTWPVSTNVDLTATGGGNPATGDWHTGIQITFKDTPPQYVVDAIAEAGGTRAKDSSKVFIISNADRKNPKVQRAVGASITVPGATIKGVK